MPRQVALFITCLTDQFYPHVGVAVTKLLEHWGCRVSFPAEQTCCGQPFFNNGYHEEASKLAKRMVAIFEPYEYVVTPSGSCCAMVREQYVELLGDDPAWSRSVRNLASKTYEFVEFLDKVLKPDLSPLTLPQSRTITYHYTCHLRALGMKDEAVELIKRIGNVRYVPLEKADQCCGFGGTFAVKYPAISGAIVEDKVKCIEATGAQTTICNEAGCAMNIAGMCHRMGVKTEVKHQAELMAEALGMNVERW